MTLKSWFRTTALVLVTALGVATAAHADSAGPGGADAAKTYRGPAGRLQQTLGLTDDQVQAIRQIREKHAPEWKQHFQAVRQTQKELRHMVVTGADESAYQAKLAELHTLMTQGLEMRVTTLKEISPILTPEQREKFADAVDQSFRFHGHRRGPRPGPSQG